MNYINRKITQSACILIIGSMVNQNMSCETSPIHSAPHTEKTHKGYQALEKKDKGPKENVGYKEIFS